MSHFPAPTWDKPDPNSAAHSAGQDVEIVNAPDPAPWLALEAAGQEIADAGREIHVRAIRRNAEHFRWLCRQLRKRIGEVENAIELVDPMVPSGDPGKLFDEVLGEVGDAAIETPVESNEDYTRPQEFAMSDEEAGAIHAEAVLRG